MNKVLIISNNCFNTYNNMGQTLTRLFNDFNKQELMQLYFYNQEPDIDICDKYYRITDVQALKSIITRKSCGSEISYKKNEVKTKQGSSAKKGIIKITRSPIQLLLRDLIWSLSSWNNKKLNSWIKENKPDKIFFAAGDCKFTYSIAIKISKKYNIPLVTYYCDDYYAESPNGQKIIERLYRKSLNNKIKKISLYSQKIICISESLKKKYDSCFNISSEVIMTPYDSKIESIPQKGEKLTMTFIGNTNLDRWKTIVELGSAIEKINEGKEKIIFNVYSEVRDDDIREHLENAEGLKFKGKLAYEDVCKEYEKSDILLHAESFEKKYIERVKHSVSTKLANYLMSGRYILAVGAAGIESIEYLKRNKAAYIIDKEEEILSLLQSFFIDNDLCEGLVSNAKDLANTNHNIIENGKKLRRLLTK